MLFKSDSIHIKIKKLINHTAFLIIHSLLLHFIKIYLETNKLDISFCNSGMLFVALIIDAYHSLLVASC